MNILDAIAPYKLMIEVAIIGSLAFGAVVKVHSAIEAHDERVRNVVRGEYAQKLAEATEAARLRETELRTQRDNAVTQGEKREKTIQTLAATANASSLGLRDTTQSISSRVPSLPEDALRTLAGAYGVLSAECGARRVEVARAAEDRNSYARTLMEAWPQ